MAKIKGMGVVGIVRALRTKREAALKELPAELRHYLDDRIVVGAWYPERDYLALLKAFVSIMRIRSYEHVGVAAAQEALQGVYRHMVGGGDMGLVATRMKANWRNYHDTGELSVESELGTVHVTIRKYAMVSAELCQLNQGYIAEHLRLNGMNVTAQRKLRCTARGDHECAWEFDWTPARRG